MSHMYRRCSKCGANQVSNPELRMHRFPSLGKNEENVCQLMSWAMFCYPDKDWSDLQALDGLHKSCKVICSKHFADSAYTTPAKIRLHKFSTPCMDENEGNLHSPKAGPSYNNICDVLEAQSQMVTEEPTAEIKTQSVPSVSFLPQSQTVTEEPTAETKLVPSVSFLKKESSRKKVKQNLTASENKVYNKCKYLMKQVNKLKTALKQKKEVDVLQVLQSDENVQRLLRQKISPSLALMLQGEMQNGQRKLQGRRWNQNQKFLALELYKKSPRTYKLISRQICLPSPSTLRRLLGQFELKAGINKMIFENIKKLSMKNPESNVCFLTFDEMSIMKNICYNPKSDEIDGYQDHGLQGKSKVLASHALVFMLVWMRRRWKQPVAFYLSGDNVTADRLTVLIKEVLHNCLKTGVNVCATVCDMDGVNVRALENLGSTVDKPYFEFEGEEIITLPDPPHLLKCFRNLFMAYDVKLPIPVQSTTMGNTIGIGVASWKHIEQFFELDNCSPHFVFAPKLTKHHIQPNGKEKMRVKLAAQIFSHSVAMGIYSKASTNELPAEAVATATFLEHFNNLFDLLNADAPDRQEGKPYKTNLTAKSPHKVFFKKSINLISEMEFIGCRRKPPSQGGWLKLLNGYERLWDNLHKKHHIKSIATRRINQDPLENCFGCIRANCGSNDNPTVAQFIAGLKTGIITNMRNIKNQRNCEDDNGELVDNYQYLFCKNKLNKKIDDPMPEPGPNVSEHDIICVSDEEIESSAETQACAYVCGFIYKKYAKDCENCKKAMLAEKPTEIHLFTQFKEYVDGKNSLHYANHSFIACVEKSAELVQIHLKENSHSDHIKENCVKLIREQINFDFLNACPEHWLANKSMIEQSVAIIIIKRFCILQNRKFSIESAKRRLAKKIKILKNS